MLYAVVVFSLNASECGNAPGGIGYHDDRFIEYDLDKEDEAWLEAFNRGQDRLPARRMELLMWRLECANAEATDRALAAAGGFLTDLCM